MKILSTNIFVGPSIFARFPVIRHILDLGILDEWPTGRLGSTFVEPLLEAMPGLHEHGCSYRTAGGFVRRLKEDEGTWLGHVMEHVAIELQNVAGSEVTFGRTRSTGGCSARQPATPSLSSTTAKPSAPPRQAATAAGAAPCRPWPTAATVSPPPSPMPPAIPASLRPPFLSRSIPRHRQKPAMST